MAPSKPEFDLSDAQTMLVSDEFNNMLIVKGSKCDILLSLNLYNSCEDNFASYYCLFLMAN